MVLNRRLYHNVHENINGYITSSIVVVRLCCNLTVEKVNEHRKLCLSSQQKGLFTAMIF